MKLKADDVEWVVNEIAELGVKIGDQFFFLYKGHSLVYNEGHDDGRPMKWRHVFKREFGECCHPWTELERKQHGSIARPNVRLPDEFVGYFGEDLSEWKEIPQLAHAEGGRTE